MSEKDEGRYRLSDGRDAREMLKTYEAVVRGEAPAIEGTLRWHEALSLGLSHVIHHDEQVDVAGRTFTLLLRNLTLEDKEILLHASHEVWGDVRSQPVGLPGADQRASFQQSLAVELRFGGLFDHYFERAAYCLEAVRGKQVDTRDADTIAEQFLHRVSLLEQLRGAEPEEALQQARRDVLGHVPKPYLAKVLVPLGRNLALGIRA